MDLDELMDENFGPGRQRTEARRDREEGVHDPHQLEFLQAVEAYQRVNRRKFLRHTEYLEIALRLGYRKKTVRSQESGVRSETS